MPVVAIVPYPTPARLRPLDAMGQDTMKSATRRTSSSGSRRFDCERSTSGASLRAFLNTGTLELSDFPRAFIIDVCLSASQYGLHLSSLQTDVGSPGSPARRFRTCMGSSTARGPNTPCENGVLGVAVRLFEERRHPGVPATCAAGNLFHGSIPSLYLPLSTLRCAVLADNSA
jgi:hypothetical protein